MSTLLNPKARPTKAERQMRMPHVVVYGNPFDGLHIIGPFPNQDEAQQYAEQHDHGDTWWVVLQETPDK